MPERFSLMIPGAPAAAGITTDAGGPLTGDLSMSGVVRHFPVGRGRWRIETSLRGFEMTRLPLLNHGTGFTPQQRETFGLQGLLPSQHGSIEDQSRRMYAAITHYTDPLEQYIALTALQDRNEHLFYRVLLDHLEEFLPVVYTPTVALATSNFSHNFRRMRGVWITPDYRGRVAEVLRNSAAFRSIRLIVATDNESILGIGDQGAGGMAISVGKLSLYIVGAGIHPSMTLPVSLDVGTDNQALLDDDLYLGWPHLRLRGDAYHSLVAEFVDAVREVFPGALVQWEDFRKDNALHIMNEYRNTLTSFNDDIQGTGAIALAALLSAMKATGMAAGQQRIIIFGAGAAGLGIARQIRAGLADLGLEGAALERAVVVLDRRGLLARDRQIDDDYKLELAWPADLVAELGLTDPGQRDLARVVEAYRPTCLIGASGQAGAFDESIVPCMAAGVERPVILPFSNPTDHSEAVPADLLRRTEGRALIATGSPFDDVVYAGTTIRIGQGNNVFIFPGLGLGTLCAGATRVSDAMIGAAAKALVSCVSDQECAAGQLFPATDRLREVSLVVAMSVVVQAMAEGIADAIEADQIEALVREAMWEPEYPELEAI